MRLLIALSLLLVAQYVRAESPIATTAGDQSGKIADLIARNQFEQAHAAALAWQESKPEDSQAAFWVGGTAGQLAMRSGMFAAMGLAKTSRKGLVSAVELDPANIRAQFSLMQFYLMAPSMMGGDKDEAQAIAERIAKQSPVEGLRAKAQLLATDKDLDGWLRENNAALALEPAHPDALGAVVGAHLGKSEFDAAKLAIDAAKAVDPQQPVVRYQYAKWAALSGQDLEPALAILDTLIALPVYPDRFSLSGAHYRRAQILAKLKRKEDAIAAYEACLAIDPDMKGVSDELEALREA